jgi:hypothetical protein
MNSGGHAGAPIFDEHYEWELSQALPIGMGFILRFFLRDYTPGARVTSVEVELPDTNEWRQTWIEKYQAYYHSQQRLNDDLGIAISNDDLTTARQLIHQGARMSEMTIGFTDLYYVISRGDVELAFFLIKQGANVDAGNGTGQTPLMIAAEKGYKALVVELLEWKARIDTRDIYGKTAVDWAVKAGQKHIVDLLRNGKRR